MVDEFGRDLAGGAGRHVCGRGRAAPGDCRGAEFGFDRGTEWRSAGRHPRRILGAGLRTGGQAVNRGGCGAGAVSSKPSGPRGGVREGDRAGGNRQR